MERMIAVFVMKHVSQVVMGSRPKNRGQRKLFLQAAQAA